MLKNIKISRCWLILSCDSNITNNLTFTIMEKKTKEQMEQFIAENINFVPNNRKNKFRARTLEQQYEDIQYYMERAKMWEELRQKNSIENKVKDMMVRRHATIEDAEKVINICKEFISSYKDEQIAKIDEEISRLTAMKQSIETNA